MATFRRSRAAVALALSANGLLGVRVTVSVAALYFAERSLTATALPAAWTLACRIGQAVDPGLVRLRWR